ncbi:ATP-dependent helicase [Clostridium sporogenes]|uniref:DNA 3'-5' helicase n=3 Tax=Clostridium TaxID=1485 RepID=A0A6M0T1N7_CLOBO|nr:ATP-dependent helicase [Clostridium sporogenes]NFA60860.1 ATP-dependent helicase [Clostridium botulinum]MDS1002799.1 ATP-dependent helicase [Clostridium sporogenes]NFI72467.1 ATP-dependent helicase [Clostridium sporogenes]NFM23635.1 ATP-dependent helicase [Clostridium sporogenes]NFP60685.1 ATP-dependent helicase [Clostridium sporogenes]
MIDYGFLDQYQKEAVKCHKDNTLVVAPPGSGKTTVIINRVVHLIENLKVNSNNILVITFTRAAAMNMKERYNKISGSIKSPFFGTFHGLFYKILNRHFKDINIISSKEAYLLINNILISYLDSVNEDKVRDVLNDISFLKTSGLTMDSFVPKIDKSIFENCFNNYEEYKSKKELLDFDDLQINMFKLLKENERVLKGYNKLFKYILVDEFQDCDTLQINILQMLCNGNSLFAVGDEDQCIYSFRGSKPECMVNFNDYFENGEKIYLRYNYRSPKNIVDISRNLIINNRLRNNKKIEAYNNYDKNIVLKSFLNEREQADEISKIIEGSIKRGYDYKDIAILYRTNMESRSLTDVFFKKRIPFRLLDKGYNFFYHFVCRDILTYMQVCIDPYDKKGFLKIINKPFRYISKLNVERVRRYKYAKNSFDILKEQKDIQPFQIKNLENLEKDINKMNKMSAQDAIGHIMHTLGYENYIKEYSERIKIDKEELLQIVDELKEAAEGYTSILTFLVHVEEVEKEINKKEVNENSVILSTIHGVKGMEFKNVIIINCNEGNIPYSKAEEEVNIEEERRLFYVGVTRAKENLYLTVPKVIRGKNKDTSNFIKECKLDKELLKNDYFKGKERVIHKVFGEGIIESQEEDYVEIGFLDGTKRKFDRNVIAKSNIIKKKSVS